MKINNKILKVIVTVILFTGVSCKKFLNVNPNNKLSGNNYWKSESDFEAYTNGLYNSLRTYTSNTTAFFNVTGEFRYNRLQAVAGVNRGSGTLSNMIGYLRNNQLKTLLSSNEGWLSSFGYNSIIDWAGFYEIIQSCNILQYQLQNVGSGILTQTEKDNFNGEAIFIRNLVYFLMVRIYGDVPYYTGAFEADAMVRTKMVDVVNNCLADLKSVVSTMPWSLMQTGSNYYGSRASRAAMYALIMNLDMWNATFDAANKIKYYQETDSIGNILINQNEGNYQLMPMTNLLQSQEIFAGFTKESLFTIPSNYNLGETFNNYAKFSYFVLTGINIDPTTPNAKSALYYENTYLTSKLFKNQGDYRFAIWFKDATNTAQTTGNFQFYKFYNIDPTNGGSSDSKIVFRMADAILLRAEALNNLGNSEESIAMLNLVKERAGLPDYVDSGEANSSTSLSDEIIWERLREFIGEGCFFYDIVRTKAILNTNFFTTVMSADDFSQGAWTWPLSNNVRTQNPGIILNTYWQ